MSDPFVLIGVLVGFGFLLTYVIQVKRRADLVDAISLILSGVGLLTGMRVCWVAFSERDVAPIKDISVQIFIGGVAICWVAVQNGIKKFFD